MEPLHKHVETSRVPIERNHLFKRRISLDLIKAVDIMLGRNSSDPDKALEPSHFRTKKREGETTEKDTPMPEIQPGLKAPTTGVYIVTHGKHRAEPHYVTVLYDEVFPICNLCGEQVRFELAVSAVYAGAHSFFKRS